ncbi:MAG: histidine kinase dimerization/phosphoacceptor domain -containing protein [Balneolaceae bacterium]|nr:histidine kinase dimerization/phosphoacceptor domain -containing protein [Balneolaceae bacterium]
MDSSSFLEQLQHTLDNSLEGAVISNISRPDQPIIYCNNAFVELSGYSREEVVGKNCRFLQKGDRDQEGLDVIRHSIHNRTPCKVVLRNYKKNGTLFYNRLSIFPLKNPRLEQNYFVGIQDDVTDIIDTKKQLGKTKNENLVLLSEVHHRVKNNLAIFSSLLEADSLKSQESSVIQKNQMRIQAMSFVHERLYEREGLSRINFADFAEQMVHYLEENDARWSIDLRFKLEIPTSLELNVNQAIPLSLMLSEFINNAYRHAYPDRDTGTVLISVDQQEEQIMLRFEDEGSGMPKELLDGPMETPGLLIAEALANQLEGELDFSNKVGGVFR